MGAFLCFAAMAMAAPPNIVIFFLDDAGYSDFQPFGNPPYATPNVARLAAEGGRYNNFHVPQAICSASRAALLTGCYPERTKVFGAHGARERGLEPSFPIMSEIFKKQGYVTGIFGKWHIGDQPDTRPAARGFDESAGMMYSHDMWEYHPKAPEIWGKYPLQFWTNGNVTCERVTPEFQKNVTQLLTGGAIDFIKRHQDQPFFLYVPFFMPHVPLFVSDPFLGKSGAGLYGDAIVELDDSIGRILAELKKCGLEENTIVIFSSDNGPYIGYGNHAGKTPFREGKITSFNGGTQSSLLIKYPAKIKPGTVSDATFCSVDLLPTLCGLNGAPLPASEIDGANVWPLISGEPGAKNPHEYYPITTKENLDAILSGDGEWILHLPHKYRHLVTPGMDGQEGKYQELKLELSLFNLKKDPNETTNVIEQFPDVARKLQQIAADHKKKFYDK